MMPFPPVLVAVFAVSLPALIAGCFAVAPVVAAIGALPTHKN